MGKALPDWYLVQEMSSVIQRGVMDRKLALSDLPQELRLVLKCYTFAFHEARWQKESAAYINTLEIYLKDINEALIRKELDQAEYDQQFIHWMNALTWGLDLYKEDTDFEQLVKKHQANYPEAFKAFRF